MSYSPATGTRIHLTIEPGLASKVARSAAVESGLRQLVEQIAADAQGTVPVNSGTLRDSEEDDVILTPTGYVGIVAYHAYYAALVHFGTRYTPANPWLQNAALNVILGRHASGQSLAA